ncbi:zinc finger matrin-type protein 1 [Drosophila montana]|uniref:zinc finger matrin-type protein 1 n=1 Tax=Drosophila montana TaxID=40370 RepID=UPI00313CCACF
MTSEYLTGYQIPLITAPGAQPEKIREIINVELTAPSVSAKRLLRSGKENPVTKMETDSVELKDTESIPAVVTQRKLKRKLNETEEGEGNNLAMFQGRDESYPEELNKLIQPLSCQLCKAQMTSMKSAKDHYESKAHDRHISAWLAKNYTEVGLQTPPIKRLVKQGPTGPNAFHCNLCDLALTSMTHARQHYAGRKHQLVVQKRSKPSGAGFYNEEGKWVRTGTKAEFVTDDCRFGIGELFIKAAASAELQEVLATNGEQQQQQQLEVKMPVVDESLTCKVCKISVTSASQIKMHLDGAKHQKNLRKQLLEEEATTLDASGGQQQHSLAAAVASDINGDLSMYRTPSGSYYCKLCNKAMNHISILQQHLQGKKHLKTVRQQTDKTISSQ